MSSWSSTHGFFVLTGRIEETFERAYRMLTMRRVLVRDGPGLRGPHANGRPLVSYYANSIAHLLGEFEAGVRSRDALPPAAGGVASLQGLFF